jgi:SAM-dependent methyltransferase
VDDLYTLLGRLESQSVVLDLGCGRGSFNYEACRGRIVAMDLSLPDNAARRPQAVYMLADSSIIPLPDASVDAVISHHTLEHFTDYKTTLIEIRRVLNPYGWLWIAVPNGKGFDDALYRFLFGGGGHVNRFSYAPLVAEVESATGTRLVRSCDLFSSFIYLQPGGPRFLSDLPAGFLRFSLFGLNAVTRMVDKALGTRFSQYGWGFVFAKWQMPVGEMPSYFNVCSKCGAGHAAESLKPARGRSLLGFGFYNCPHCRGLNVLVPPPPNLD